MVSVILPVYNQEKNIERAVNRAELFPFEKEIIVVNDGSKDNTELILNRLTLSSLKVIHHVSNRGRVAAVLTGLENAKGDLVIIQSADSVYNPNDYAALFTAMQDSPVDIMIGRQSIDEHSGRLFFKVVRSFMVKLAGLLFGHSLKNSTSDYMLMRKESILGLGLKSNNLDIENEILSKAIKMKLQIRQLAVSPTAPAIQEGNK